MEYSISGIIDNDFDRLLLTSKIKICQLQQFYEYRNAITYIDAYKSKYLRNL